MDIKFIGESLSGKIIESDSILQGKKAGAVRIFLKDSDRHPKWIECKSDTVKQMDVFTKEQLREAWNHGAVRSPKKYRHCNNFDVYFKNRYKTKSDEKI